MTTTSILPGMVRADDGEWRPAERYRCDACGETWTYDELELIVDIGERVAAGEICPAGECPDCGTLCHVDGSPYALAIADGVMPPLDRQGGMTKARLDAQDAVLCQIAADCNAVMAQLAGAGMDRGDPPYEHWLARCKAARAAIQATAAGEIVKTAPKPSPSVS